ncbi:hypothetical protein IV102_20675 [bacterium]|nr:hypothetical protein [bacterium]
MLLGLGSVRDDWELRWDMETALIRRLSVRESAAQLEALYREFRHELHATESIFASPRMESMVELQARLGKLNR